MRARPNPSGEQLVTDYLTRVAQAARLLPKGPRMAFVGRTRALVEREVGPPGTRTDPERVSAVLARLGTPEDLVIEERTRIDQGWVKSRAGTKEEGEAAAAALTRPLDRRLTPRRRSGSDSQPLTGRLFPPGQSPAASGPDAPGPDGIGPDGSGAGAPPAPDTSPWRPRTHGPRSSAARTTGLREAGTPGTRGPSPATRPQRGAPPATGPQRGAPPATGPQRGAPPATGPQRGASPATGPRRLRSADSPEPPTFPPGMEPQRGGRRQDANTGKAGHTGALDRLIGQVPGAETFTANTGRLARENLLESVAVLLLGLGGLILPFPFWPIGAVVALFSRLWDLRDKSLGIVGPLLVTLALSVIAAPFVGGSGNVIVVYFHAVHVSFGLFVRVGSVLTAAYLAWRVSKGPRVKVPPWRRITR